MRISVHLRQGTQGVGVKVSVMHQGSDPPPMARGSKGIGSKDVRILRGYADPLMTEPLYRIQGCADPTGICGSYGDVRILRGYADPLMTEPLQRS